MGWLSDKMGKWERITDRLAGSGKGRRVVEGWESLPQDLSAIAAWSVKAQERLEAQVPDETVRRRIMAERSCVFTEEFGDTDLRALREIYAATQSVGKVLEAMREHRARFGEPFLEGGTIVEIRSPRDKEAFSKAKNDRERRIAACYCPLAREAEGRMPLEYCCWSAGWYKGIYEGIFGVPVEVSVDESLLNGDPRCRFTIRVPGVL